MAGDLFFRRPLGDGGGDGVGVGRGPGGMRWVEGSALEDPRRAEATSQVAGRRPAQGHGGGEDTLLRKGPRNG